MILRRLLPAALLIALLALGLCAALGAAAPPPPDGFQLNGDAERGRAVYAKSCAVCHGVTGDGKSKMAGTLKPPPTDFTSKALIDQRSDWELYLVARDGGPALGLSPAMYGWKGLLPNQGIRDAVAYVRTLGH